jgi:hypothetical protein
MTADPVCEVCGAPAVWSVLDTTVQIQPVIDAKGRWWPCYEGKGGYHRYCAAHRRPTKYEESPEYQAWLRDQNER